MEKLGRLVNDFSNEDTDNLDSRCTPATHTVFNTNYSTDNGRKQEPEHHADNETVATTKVVAISQQFSQYCRMTFSATSIIADLTRHESLHTGRVEHWFCEIITCHSEHKWTNRILLRGGIPHRRRRHVPSRRVTAKNLSRHHPSTRVSSRYPHLKGQSHTQYRLSSEQGAVRTSPTIWARFFSRDTKSIETPPLNCC